MSTEGTASEEQWHWSKKNSDERNGPVGRERLEKLAEEGNLKPGDLVWTEGMEGWEEADSVEGLEESFISPPPLPNDSGDEKAGQPPPLPSADSRVAAAGNEPPALPQGKGQVNFNRANVEYEYRLEVVKAQKSAQRIIDDYSETGWTLDKLEVDRREGLTDINYFYIVFRKKK